MSRRRDIVIAAAIIIWIGTVLAGYYVVHKPFVPANVRALGNALAGLLGAALVTALGIGIGLALLRRLEMKPLERLVWTAGIGLGMVATAGLALGAVGLLRPWLLWLLAVAGIAFTGRPLWRALRATWSDPSWRAQSRFEQLLAGYCAVMLAVALVWALTPPTAWDGLVYHLTGPKLYLASGKIFHPFDLPYLGFPQLVEMLFAWGMGLTGERAAAAIHWFYGLLAVGAILGNHKEGNREGCPYVAGAVLLSVPSIVLLMGWPYVEMALILYTTLSFLALMRFCEGGRQAQRWLVLSGVCAGLALSTKYTALAVLPALAVARCLCRPQDAGSKMQDARCRMLDARDRRQEAGDKDSPFAVCHLKCAIRDWLAVCGVALAVWSPWLIKNLLLTGNPLYPFFLRGIYWDDWRAWWYDRPGTGLAYTAPWKLLTAPWDATIWGVEGAAGYSATIGPLFLALLPLLLLVWRYLPGERRRWLTAALAFCGIMYAFWLWGIARTALLLQSRLLFPAFGVLALVIGGAVEGTYELPPRPLNLGWLVRAVILIVLGLTLTGESLPLVRERPLDVLLGFESEEDFLNRRLGWYAVAIDYINRELPSDAVVLFLWEPRSYHCRAECRPDALLDRWLHTTHIYGHNAEAIANAWRAEGVTHVLLYRVGFQAIVEARFDPLTPADRRALDELRSHHLTLVGDLSGVYELYRLEGNP